MNHPPLPGPLMVIDDDPLDLEMMGLLLRRVGLDGSLATHLDPGVALAALRWSAAGQPVPVLILSDLNMPAMDGFSLLREIRDDPRLGAVPVVFLSGAIRRGEIERARASGANGLLRKFPCPGTLADLVARARDGRLADTFVAEGGS